MKRVLVAIVLMVVAGSALADHPYFIQIPTGAYGYTSVKITALRGTDSTITKTASSFPYADTLTLKDTSAYIIRYMFIATGDTQYAEVFHGPYGRVNANATAWAGTNTALSNSLPSVTTTTLAGSEVTKIGNFVWTDTGGYSFLTRKVSVYSMEDSVKTDIGGGADVNYDSIYALIENGINAFTISGDSLTNLVWNEDTASHYTDTGSMGFALLTGGSGLTTEQADSILGALSHAAMREKIWEAPTATYATDGAQMGGALFAGCDTSTQATTSDIATYIWDTYGTRSLTEGVTVTTNNDKDDYNIASVDAGAIEDGDIAAGAIDWGGEITGTGITTSFTADVPTANWNAATASYGTSGTYGLLVETNLDAAITSRLAPTVASRTLDVTATGEAGLDFSNVAGALDSSEFGTTYWTALPSRVWHYRIDTVPQGATGFTAGWQLSQIPTTASSSNWTNAQRDSVLNILLDTSWARKTWTSPAARTITGGSLSGAQTWSLTGNITGNLTGSVGSVTGAVGSVTGAVGSVTGNVGGNVVGSVGSVTAAVSTSTSDKNALVDLNWDEPQSGHTTSGTFGYNLDSRVSTSGGASGWTTDEKDSALVALSDSSMMKKVWAASSRKTLYGTQAFSNTGTWTGNLTGSVGSVTGNVGGNVTGSVASVTGNLGGNVTGSVGSISGITFPTYFSQLAVQNGTGYVWTANGGGTATIPDSLLQRLDSIYYETFEDTSSLRLSGGSATVPDSLIARVDSTLRLADSMLDRKISDIPGMPGLSAFTRTIVVIDTGSATDSVLRSVMVYANNIAESATPQPDMTDNTGTAYLSLTVGSWVIFTDAPGFAYHRKTITISGAGTDTLKVYRSAGDRTTVAWYIQKPNGYGWGYPKLTLELVSVHDSDLYIADSLVVGQVTATGSYNGLFSLDLYPNSLFALDTLTDTGDSTYYQVTIRDSKKNLLISSYKFIVPDADTTVKATALTRWRD